MEGDAAIVLDTELNAAFRDEAAVPIMPSSRCNIDRVHNSTSTAPGSCASAQLFVTNASNMPITTTHTVLLSNTSVSRYHGISTSASENVLSSEKYGPRIATTASDTTATDAGGLLRSAPRVRRFLYPAASQIARDTPDRRRRPRTAAAPRRPRTPVDQQRPAATDTALTPAEQRDVQACLVSAMETLEDDGDTFFTQCRANVPPHRSKTTISPKWSTAERFEEYPESSVHCSKNGDDTGCERMETEGVVEDVVPEERNATSGAGSMSTHTFKERTPATSEAPDLSAPSGSIQSVRRLRPTMGSSGEHHTPAGRPADRPGRAPRAKRLWSAADNPGSEDDEPGCSPVLLSHKKKRRHEQRPAPTSELESPMEEILMKNTRACMVELVAKEKTESPVNLSPTDLMQLTKCSEFTGFSTATGRRLIASKQAIQKAVALLRDIDGPSNDDNRLNPVTCERRCDSNIGKQHDKSDTASVGCSVLNPAGLSANPASREVSERMCNPTASTVAEPSEASGHGGEFMVGFQTASGKPLAISNEAVKLARAKFVQLEENSSSDKVVVFGQEKCLLGDRKGLHEEGKRCSVAYSKLARDTLRQVEEERDGDVNIILTSSTTSPVAADGVKRYSNVCTILGDSPSILFAATVMPESSATSCVSRPSTSISRPVCETAEVGEDLRSLPKSVQPSSPSPATLRLAEKQGDFKAPFSSSFQTADGRKVTLSAKAFVRAKSLFDDINADVVVETNSESSRLAASKKIHPIASRSFTPCLNCACTETMVTEADCPAVPSPCAHQIGTSCSSDQPSGSRPQTSNERSSTFTNKQRLQWNGGGFCGKAQNFLASVRSGFVTASGHPLVISEAALEAAWHMMESTGEDDVKGEISGVETVADSEQPGDIAEMFQPPASEIALDVGRNTRYVASRDHGTPAKGHSHGFPTAGGRNVKVSENPVRKVKTLFDDDVAGEPKPVQGFPSNIEPPCDSGTIRDEINGKDIQEKADGAEKLAAPALPTIHSSLSFTPPGGKSVVVPEIALNDVKMMAGETIEANSSARLALECPVGFIAAGRNPGKVSEHAFKQAKAMLDSGTVNGATEEKQSAEPELVRAFGFATASEKPVDISGTALKEASVMLAGGFVPETVGADIYVTPKVGRPAEFATGGEKPVKSAEATISKAGTSGDENVDEAMDTYSVQPVAERPCGFATAGGKPVIISQTALKKAKALLDTDNDSGVIETEEDARPKLQHSRGFATASGRCVKLSEAALKQSRAVLNSDVDKSMELDKATERQTSHPIGFAAASRQRVKVPETALKKAKAMLDVNNFGLKEGDPEKSASKRACGFATASGKFVEVSDTALEKVKTMFDDDIHGETLEAQEPAELKTERLDGFANASGKLVGVSEDLLKKAKQIFDSANREATDENFKEPEESHPCGFTTAAGKSVGVSEAAVRKAKAMLDSIEGTMQADVPLKRFTMVNEQLATVSKEVLEKTIAVVNGENSNQSLNTNICPHPDSKTCLHALPVMKDTVHGTAKSAGSAVSTPDEHVFRKPKVRFLSCGKVPRRCVGSQQSDCCFNDCAVRPTSIVSPSPTLSVADSRSSHMEGPSVRPGTPHPSASRKMATGEPDTSTTERDQSDWRCVGGDSERCHRDADLASAGLTQVLDERFEFTQVVAEQRRHADEERSASPVLGTARRRRAGRRRTSEPAVFRTPYRSGPPRRAPAAPPAVQSPAPAVAPPADSAAESTGAAASAAAVPPEDASSCSSMQTSRAEARRRQTEAGAERRVTRSLGSLLQTRLKTAADGAGRRSLRDALGPRPANLTRDELISLDVPVDVLDITFASAASYRFRCTETTIEVDGCVVVPADDDTVGEAEVRAALLSSPGVQPSLVPQLWVQNAFRHVVWKLAAYERQFPDEMSGRCLTVKQLVRQLRYRYDRELDRCERPALRRITEADDSAAKTLILCLADVSTPAEGVRLLVSDGWYCVPAQGDAALQRLARLGRLTPGLKLVIHGAELTGQQSPCSPLEASAELCLRFSTNSCRRARWDARLGYHSNPAPFASCLSAVLPDGGSVARLDAAIARVYPLLYYGKEEGGGVFRTARCERRRAAAAEAASQARLERLYAAVERQLGSQEPAPAGTGARRPVSGAAVRHLTTGQQIYECVAAAGDPSTVESLLSAHQRRLAAEYQRTLRDQHRERLEVELRARLQQEPHTGRPATPLLRVRLAGKDNVPANGAILTLWRPSDELQAFLVEGRSVSLLGVAANGTRSGVLQLSAGSQLRLQPGPAGLSAPPRLLVLPQLQLATCRPPYSELELAAAVLRVGACGQTVHLADRSGALISALCWPTLKALGLEELVVPGALLAFCSLQLCSGSARPPLCAITERTEVTGRPADTRLAHQLRLLTAAMAGCTGLLDSARSTLDSALAAGVKRTLSMAAAPSVAVTMGRSPGPRPRSPVTQSCGGLNRPAQWAVSAAPAGPGDCSAVRVRLDGDGLRPTQRRLQALQRYGPAPPIGPLASPLPASLRRPFRSPRPARGHTPAGASTSTSRPAATPGAAAVTHSEDDLAGGGDYEGAATAAEIIRLAVLEGPAETADSPPIEPDSQLA